MSYLTSAAEIRAAAGAVVYLTLICLLSRGVAAAVRDSAVVIWLVLGLLYLIPVAASLVSKATLARRLQQIRPLSADLDGSGHDRGEEPAARPVAGARRVALWTAGALFLGALVLKYRDALRPAWDSPHVRKHVSERDLNPHGFACGVAHMAQTKKQITAGQRHGFVSEGWLHQNAYPAYRS